MLSIYDITGILLTALVSYLIGSFNFAIIVSKLNKDDVRKHGSGNAGMTNMLRTYGKKAAVFTSIGDAAKAVVAVIIAKYIIFDLFNITIINPDYFVGIFVLLGHVFPLYFGFKGGKGVMTSMGVQLAVNPTVLVCLLAVALPIVFKTRFVSLGSIVAGVLFPVFTLIFKLIFKEPYIFDVLCAIIISCIVLLVHRDNIRRLLNGTENRF